MINSTLCYLERGDAYLMLHRVKKKGDLNHDKWIGVGGKFEDGESPEDCILRETWEETGLTLTDREGTAFRGLAGCPPVDTAAGIYGLFYQLLPACWGRGLGLAAAAEALRRLERLAPALVLADTVAENTASVRILERLGFVRTAVHHRAFCREGRMLDIWDYARRWAGPAETV